MIGLAASVKRFTTFDVRVGSSTLIRQHDAEPDHQAAVHFEFSASTEARPTVREKRNDFRPLPTVRLGRAAAPFAILE
jgi:hypothetical protein